MTFLNQASVVDLKAGGGGGGGSAAGAQGGMIFHKRIADRVELFCIHVDFGFGMGDKELGLMKVFLTFAGSAKL